MSKSEASRSGPLRFDMQPSFDEGTLFRRADEPAVSTGMDTSLLADALTPAERQVSFEVTDKPDSAQAELGGHASELTLDQLRAIVRAGLGSKAMKSTVRRAESRASRSNAGNTMRASESRTHNPADTADARASEHKAADARAIAGGASQRQVAAIRMARTLRSEQIGNDK